MAPHIKIKGFSQFEEINLDIVQFIVFSGQNGTGKTLLIKLYHGIIDSLTSDDSHYEYSGIFRETEKKLNRSYSYEETAELFDTFIEHQLQPHLILKKVFGHTNFNLDYIEFDTSYFPKMKFTINSLKDVGKHTLKIHFDDKEIDDVEENITFPVKDENEEDFLLDIIYSISLPILIRKSLRSIFKTKLEVNISPKRSLYFPASREAYIRDFDQLVNTIIIKTKTEVESYIKKILDESKSQNISKKTINKFVERDLYKTSAKFSKDPYIEHFCNNLAKISQIKLNGSENKDIDPLLDYLQNNILKSEFSFTDGSARYSKSEEISYTPLNASSLENEYSILYDTLRKTDYDSFIIEEPEAHLSMTNSMNIMWFFVGMFLKGYRFSLSTHSTVVMDCINICYLLSKIDKSKIERMSLESIPLDVLNISEEVFNKIEVLYLNGEAVEKLTPSTYGYNMTDFNHQIGEINDILLEIEENYEASEAEK